jgi:hypothetical protein
MQLQNTPGCKKLKIRGVGGGGVAKCILHQDAVTSVCAAGLPNAKGRAGCTISSRLQLCPPEDNIGNSVFKYYYVIRKKDYFRSVENTLFLYITSDPLLK